MSKRNAKKTSALGASPELHKSHARGHVKVARAARREFAQQMQAGDCQSAFMTLSEVIGHTALAHKEINWGYKRARRGSPIFSAERKLIREFAAACVIKK